MQFTRCKYYIFSDVGSVKSDNFLGSASNLHLKLYKPMATSRTWHGVYVMLRKFL